MHHQTLFWQKNKINCHLVGDAVGKNKRASGSMCRPRGPDDDPPPVLAAATGLFALDFVALLVGDPGLDGQQAPAEGGKHKEEEGRFMRRMSRPRDEKICFSCFMLPFAFRKLQEEEPFLCCFSHCCVRTRTSYKKGACFSRERGSEGHRAWVRRLWLHSRSRRESPAAQQQATPCRSIEEKHTQRQQEQEQEQCLGQDKRHEKNRIVFQGRTTEANAPGCRARCWRH